MNIFSQDIRGIVYSEDSIPLAGATIIVNEIPSTTTNTNGLFLVSPKTILDNSATIKISFIGYETKKVIISTANNKDYIPIFLKKKPVEIKTVEVTSERFNLFESKNYVLINYAVINGKIVALYEKNNSTTLGFFNTNGELHSSQIFDKQYKKLEVSCIGTLFLEQKASFDEYEINTQFNQANYIGNLKSEIYIKYGKPCIYEVEGGLVKLRFSNYNKKAKFVFEKKDGTTKSILEVFDEDAAKVSQSYYNEIIIEYYEYLRSISHLGEPLNLIKEGLWKGDVNKLAKTVELTRIINNYQLLELKPWSFLVLIL